MREIFFAGNRMLIDDELYNYDNMSYLEIFKKPTDYTDTFYLHKGSSDFLDERYISATVSPRVCTTDRFTVHALDKGWAFASVDCEYSRRYNYKFVLYTSPDYREQTLYMSDEPYFDEIRNFSQKPPVPFSSVIRCACESGMALKNGISLHASLVRKDGFGIAFLGPSGMGKSTQAGLWEKYQGADFIIGDRPGLRCIDGVWYAFGMPWDGKDFVLRQDMIPLKALVVLNQAKENRITRLDCRQAMTVLLRQTILPMWDVAAVNEVTFRMDKLANELPFYYLDNLPNEAATLLTYETIAGENNI